MAAFTPSLYFSCAYNSDKLKPHRKINYLKDA